MFRLIVFIYGKYSVDQHRRAGLKDIGACCDPFTSEGYWMDKRQSGVGSLHTCADKWSGEERGPTTVKQTVWDRQETDVFLCRAHKHEPFSSEDGWRARSVVNKSAKTEDMRKNHRTATGGRKMQKRQNALWCRNEVEVKGLKRAGREEEGAAGRLTSLFPAAQWNPSLEVWMAAHLFCSLCFMALTLPTAAVFSSVRALTPPQGVTRKTGLHMSKEFSASAYLCTRVCVRADNR